MEEAVLGEWCELLRFESVGADGARLKECVSCASWLRKWLQKLGFDVDRKIIVVKDVKSVGDYVATVKLHKEVSAQVAFKVIAEGAPVVEAPATEAPATEAPAAEAEAPAEDA